MIYLIHLLGATVLAAPLHLDLGVLDLVVDGREVLGRQVLWRKRPYLFFLFFRFLCLKI